MGLIFFNPIMIDPIASEYGVVLGETQSLNLQATEPENDRVKISGAGLPAGTNFEGQSG